MASIVVAGDTSGTVTLSAPATAGTTTLTLPTTTGTVLASNSATTLNSGASAMSLQTNSTTAVTIDTSQNVGIGTSSPSSPLNVVKSQNAGTEIILDNQNTGSSVYANYKLINSVSSGGAGVALFGGSFTTSGVQRAGGMYIYAQGSNTGGITMVTEGAQPLYFGTSSTERMRLTGASLCIGNTSPNSSFLSSAARLTVGQWGLGPTVDYGNFYLSNAGGVGVQLISGNTSWSALSDERTKTDLKPIENAIEKVSTLRAVTGRYIKDEDTVSRAFLIAQDVQAVLPEAVDAGEDEEQTLQLKYTDTIPLLVAAIKEQQAIIETLKADIEDLKAKVK